MSMNYQPVFVGNQTNGNAGTKVNINAGQAEKKTVSGPQYVLLPFMTFDSQGPKSSEDEVTNDAGKKNGVLDPAKEGDKNGQEKDVRDQEEALRKQFEQESERLFGQGKATNFKSTNRLNTVSSSVNVVSSSFTTVDPGREKAQRNEFESVFGQDKDANSNNTYRMFTPVSTAESSYVHLGGSIPVNVATLPNANLPIDPLIPELEDTVDLQVTGIFSSAYDDEDVGDEADLNNLETTMNVSPIPTTRIYKDHPKEQIIGDLNLATQTRKMINFSKELGMVSYINKQRRTNHKDYQNCLFACFLSQQKPKKVIQALTDPSWIEAMQEELLQFKLQKVWTLVDLPKGKRAIGTKWVYRNKKYERGIVVRNKARLVAQAPRAWYETLSTYLLENGFRRGTIDKTLFIKKAIGDILLVQVYVDDIIFGSTKKSLCTDFEGLMHKKFQMSSMGELTFFLGLQVMQRDDGIFISQDKYVVDILKKFDFSLVKKASTPIETNKALLKDKEAEDVDVHLYRSMIGLLMYLTASRPDIMFAVCACARDSPFDLEAFSNSDYARASLDRKSTTRGCQFLGKRLISWQCKKQTIVANSTTEAEYVAAANCCGQVLWIQNKMLDYGFIFMNTKIYIDNESTICIVKNPVFHSKTKHIEIRHHFIRDSYEKKLIQVINIYIDHNVANLLTKAFDVSRFNFLIASNGLLNP
ncbi:putative ribonuclease H-like domain-containing protein [Tanacetum coccineum]